MSVVWTKAQLEEALGVVIPIEISSGKVEFNTKDLNKNDIFIALPGSVRDGHEFIDEALEREVAAVISSKKHSDPRVILVPDTKESLLKLANYKRSNTQAKFIGITGSVGKTSTKEMLGTLLGVFEETFFNKGNFNNHIGVPISLASIGNDVKYSVNEMGMNNSGEIRELTKLVRPNIAIITTIGEAHLENLGSVENICKAKCEIFESLEPNGIAIINHDNPYYDLQREILEKLQIKNIYSFGISKESNASIVSFNYADGVNIVRYNILGEEYLFENRLFGRHQSVNLASVLLAIKLLGHDPNNLSKKISELESYSGRGKFYNFKVNENNLTFIDDAYNANPVSMKASFSSLAGYNNIEKYAIIADMKELGNSEVLLHEDLKNDILNAGVTKLFTVGPLMENLYKKIKNDIDSFHFDLADKESFASIISKINKSAMILVKGSNSTKIRTIIDYINSNFEKIK